MLATLVCRQTLGDGQCPPRCLTFFFVAPVSGLRVWRRGMSIYRFLAASFMYFLAGLSNLPFLDRKKTFEIGGHSLFLVSGHLNQFPLSGSGNLAHVSSRNKTLSLIPDTT